MSSEQLYVEATAGWTVYFCVWNAAGQVLDFADNTFKAVGSATTPALAATERTGPAGAASLYVASLDLSLLNKTGLPIKFWIEAFHQAAGSPAPATDTIIAGNQPQPVKVRFAELDDGSLRLEFNPVFESTSGLTFDLCASLSFRGVRVPLETYAPTATLALAVRQFGAGADLFDIAATTVNALGRFELTQATPGFTADRLYWYRFTLVENANTWVFEFPVPNHG